MDGGVGGWVGGISGQWVGLSQSTKNLINLDLIEIILFEDLWFVETPPPMGGCVGGWVGQWVGSGQMTNNWISLDLIEIIQFCLKIYDL